MKIVKEKAFVSHCNRIPITSIAANMFPNIFGLKWVSKKYLEYNSYLITTVVFMNQILGSERYNLILSKKEVPIWEKSNILR